MYETPDLGVRKHRNTQTERDAEIYRAHAHELTRLATVFVGPADASDLVSDAVVQSLSSPSLPAVTNHRAGLGRAAMLGESLGN